MQDIQGRRMTHYAGRGWELGDQMAVRRVSGNVGFVVVQCLGLEVDQLVLSCEVGCC